MNKVNSTDRVAFLAEQFKVYTEEEYLAMEINEHDANYTLIKNHSGLILAFVKVTLKKDSEYEGRKVQTFKKDINISETVFFNMVAADPTDNKIYLQWLLTIFTKYIKDNKIEDAIRFADEDLPHANEYLILFEGNKRKTLFKKLCFNNSTLLKITDPTNINQYKSLSQVFDVIDPFIERDASTLEKAFKRFVDLGEAEIPVRDRNFTLYIPKSLESSVILSNFASWCTTREGNGMLASYTSKPTPTGEKSKLYVIIDNNLYKGESEEMWQIHFESNQLMNRRNSREGDFYDKVLQKSEALSNYFYQELMTLAKAHNDASTEDTDRRIEGNNYLKYLVDFGHPEALFDVLDENCPSINMSKRVIPKLPDLTRFKNLGHLFLADSRLKELNESLKSLTKLEMISVPNNNLTRIPEYIGECRNLVFMNLTGNHIKYIPNEISKLDPTNGGRLHRLSIRKEEIGEDNYLRLQQLLPSVQLTSNLVAG